MHGEDEMNTGPHIPFTEHYGALVRRLSGLKAWVKRELNHPTPDWLKPEGLKAAWVNVKGSVADALKIAGAKADELKTNRMPTGGTPDAGTAMTEVTSPKDAAPSPKAVQTSPSKLQPADDSTFNGLGLAIAAILLGTIGLPYVLLSLLY